MLSRQFRLFSSLIMVAMVALALSGCSGSSSGGGGGSPNIDNSGDNPSGPDNLGSWNSIMDGGIQVGVSHTEHDLFARYAAGGSNPTLSASSPANQPTVAGTWSGKWAANHGDELEMRDDGDARINVTIAGSRVDATLTYSGINIPSVPGSITSAPASVTDGRFAPRTSVNVQGVTFTFAGEGQFGGADQQGVAGYVSGPGFRSIFYGDKQ